MTDAAGTAATPKKTYLFYRPQDFLLYVFSLLIVGVVGWFAFGPVARVLLIAGLVYMAGFFVMKHGAAFDGGSFGVIARGLWSYPAQIFARLVRDGRRQLTALAVFAGALGLERWVAARSPEGAWWLQPFPYQTAALVAFGVILLPRTLIFVAHLRRSAQVREILQSSDWHRELKNVHIVHHVIQAYVSGLIVHACLLMPALIFWSLTDPTWFREGVLLAGSIATAPWISARQRMRRLEIPFSAKAMFLNTFVLTPASRVDESLHDEHRQSHQARFDFTVIHGHHHDAIPSALIGAPGYGYWEAVHQGLGTPAYLQGAFFSLFFQTASVFFDMIGHQYIPGVPPFTRFVITAHMHHVVHHYGSVRPLGLTGPPYERDVEAGYNPDNRRVRWFLETAKKYEKLDDALLQRFTSLAGTGNMGMVKRAGTDSAESEAGGRSAA